MKNLVLALILTFGSSFIFANGDEPASTTVEGKTVTFNFSDYNDEVVHMTIIDNRGSQIYAEDINSKSTHRRTYSLEQLPTGSYFVKLTTTQRIITNKIEIENNHVKIYNEEVSFKPQMTFDNNRWNINVLSQNKDTNIDIYDDEEKVYTETITDKMGFNKSYDLSNLKYGKYYAVIKVGDNLYTDTFVIAN